MRNVNVLVNPIWALFLLLALLASTAVPAQGSKEQIIRTGLQTECRNFSVSPVGDSLIFDTASLTHGLKLIDLKTGAIRPLPSEPGRYWEMARWDSDGKRLVAVSTLVRDNNYIIRDQRVILIDPRDGSHRVIASGEGVKIMPFFSADGRRIYYFKGHARTSGRTMAAGFDLFSVDVASGQEEQQTDEAFYQVSVGDAGKDGAVVLFSARGGKNFRNIKDEATGISGGSRLLAFDTGTKRLTPVRIHNPNKIFELSQPTRDDHGRLRFIAATQGNKGYFLYALYNIDKSGEPPRKITDVPIWAGYEVVRRTGDVYFPEMQQGELVFRHLAPNPIPSK